MARDELPRQGVGGVGFLVVTRGGECRKAPLLVTYDDDVTYINTKTLFHYQDNVLLRYINNYLSSSA